MSNNRAIFCWGKNMIHQVKYLVASCTLLLLLLITHQNTPAFRDAVRPDVKKDPNTVDVSHTASMSISIDKHEFKPSEPVIVHVTLNNLAKDHSLVCMHGMSKYRLFRVIASDPNGEVPQTRFGKRIAKGDGAGGDLMVGPGKVYSCDLSVNRVRDLSAPGRYTLRVQLEFTHPGRKPQEAGSVTSNPVEFTLRYDPTD